MLKRATLRKLIVAKLLNKTLAGPRVYSGLPFETTQDDCPCILVYASQENRESRARHTPLLECTLNIGIEVRVAEDYKTAEDKVDAICEQIELLLLSDPDILGEVESISGWTTNKAWENGGEYPFSIAIITMQAQYKREIPVATDGEFLAARINVDAVDPADPNIAQPGPDGRIEAVQDVIVNQ